jgi:hypothetical protein
MTIDLPRRKDHLHRNLRPRAEQSTVSSCLRPNEKTRTQDLLDSRVFSCNVCPAELVTTG